MDLLTQGNPTVLTKIINSQASNPAYQAALAKAAKKNPKLAAQLKAVHASVPQTEEMKAVYKQSLMKYRIEDHPEYNNFAREMRSQCLTNPLSGKSKKNLSCYSCNVKK